MAKLLLFLFLAGAVAAASADSMLQSEKLAPPAKPEKHSHLRFFFHDVSCGGNPTAVIIEQAASTNQSATLFGLATMMDDALTVGPEWNSTLVERAQGIYAIASQQDVSLVMAMNFAFVEGKYNGNSLALLGRNSVLLPVRELPIAGGSGLFRFAQGYAQARTHGFDATNKDGIYG